MAVIGLRVPQTHAPGSAVSIEREYLVGARAMLPLLAGVAPFGMVVGTAVAACRAPVAGWAATWLVYGGSAHLAVLDATGGWAGIAGAVAAALLINTRLVVYGVTMGRHWRDERVVTRALLAATLVDPSFAVGEARYRRPGCRAGRRSFYVGAALTLWFGWMIAVTAGMLAGSAIGSLDAFDLVVPMCLAALVAPAISRRAGRAAGVVAAVVAVVASGWPSGTGLLVAIVAGAAAGALAEGGAR